MRITIRGVYMKINNNERKVLNTIKDVIDFLHQQILELSIIEDDTRYKDTYNREKYEKFYKARKYADEKLLDKDFQKLSNELGFENVVNQLRIYFLSTNNSDDLETAFRVVKTHYSYLDVILKK
jgi:hypothetical protein